MQNSIKKYIYNGTEVEVSKHWIECEKNKLPFIEVRDRGKFYSEIFYDITNIADSEQLQESTNLIKKFYSMYIKFIGINFFIVQKYFDQYYFFEFLVDKECSQYIASKLFDYLTTILKKDRC